MTTLRVVRKPEAPATPADPLPPVPLLVSLSEAARALGGVSTSYVARLVRDGKLRAVGQRKARRIVYASILAYVEQEAANG